MSTGYGWEGIRQVCATLLGARHVNEKMSMSMKNLYSAMYLSASAVGFACKGAL